MANKSKLEALEALEKAPTGFDYLKVREYTKLVEQGLVEVNTAMQDETGAHACRLTPAGVEYTKNLSNPGSATAPETKEKPTMNAFRIYTAPVPASKRSGGAGRPSKYPFDQLEVGQMFFVPVSEKQPEPVKSLGSVVTSANRRYATATDATKKNRKGKDIPVLSYTRKFTVRATTQTDEAGNVVSGAGVWRTK